MSRRGSESSERRIAPQQAVEQAPIESSGGSMIRGSVSIIGSAVEKRAGSTTIKSADPCLIHSLEFMACVGNYNIPSEKCEEYLDKMFQCRERT